MQEDKNNERFNRLTQYINERSLGPNTPISVGTAMIFDNEEVDYGEWEPYLYVNLHTILRNLIQAMDINKVLELDDEVLFPKFMEEIETFEEYLDKYTSGKTEAVFYLPDYRNISRMLPFAGLRTIKTDRQQQLYDLEQAVYKRLREEVKKMEAEAKKVHQSFEKPYIETDHTLPRGKGPALILTHNPTDLLSYTSFPVLKLIESHTGKIKKRDEWNTKLTGDKVRLANIPFNRFSVQICGDGNHLIMSGTKKMKDFLFELADKNNWTSMTTIDRIRFCINLMKDKTDRETLLKWI